MLAFLLWFLWKNKVKLNLCKWFSFLLMYCVHLICCRVSEHCEALMNIFHMLDPWFPPEMRNWLIPADDCLDLCCLTTHKHNHTVYNHAIRWRYVYVFSSLPHLQVTKINDHKVWIAVIEARFGQEHVWGFKINPQVQHLTCLNDVRQTWVQIKRKVKYFWQLVQN